MHVGYHLPLAGMGLIEGATKSGAARSAETPIEEVRRCTVFLERQGDRLRETRTPWPTSEPMTKATSSHGQ